MRTYFSDTFPLSAFSAVLLLGTSTPAAFAGCGMPQVGGGGSGPPSISVTEASTEQVLEQVRRRVDASQTQTPIPVSTTAPAQPESAPAAAETPPEAPVGQAKAKKVKPKAPAPVESEQAPEPTPEKAAAKSAKKKVVEPVAEPAEEPSAPAGQGSLKDAGYAPLSGQNPRMMGVWSQGFVDFERHDNLAPGNKENPARRSLNGGGVVGVDWTARNGGAIPEARQFGVFAGYSATRDKFSDTDFEVVNTVTGNDNFHRSDSRQDIDGPFVGAYMAYVHNHWTTDLTFKADFLDVDAKSRLLQTTAGCGVGDFGIQSGSASLTNYMAAANLAYRNPLSEHSWVEPSVGVRVSFSDFSNDQSVTVFHQPVDPTSYVGRLGLEDGHAVRVQVGGRYGDQWFTPEGYRVTATFGAYLYSDVLIDGFTFTSPTTVFGAAGGETVGPVDEGKIRALGIITSRVEVDEHLSYLFEAQIRGGEDLIGFGGKLGVRYEW